MLVELKHSWFAPSEVVVKDKIQSISGRRYKRGIHEIADSLKDRLPKGAVILEDVPAEKIEVESTDLRDYDQERQDADKFTAMTEEADKAALKAKQDRMAKARAAKGAKKGNATVE